VVFSQGNCQACSGKILCQFGMGTALPGAEFPPHDTMTDPESTQAAQTTNSGCIRRRTLLGQLGLAGLGVVAGAGQASAFITKKSADRTPRVTVPTASGHTTPQPVVQSYSAFPDLPEEWARTNGPQAAEYLRYLSSLSLVRVCPKQVIECHAKSKGNVWNTLPPKIWWRRMGYVLRIVDRIGKEMNVSNIEIISAYRAPGYNAHCRGARAGSWHQANVAVDVKFPVRASQVTATARELRDLGLFRGGVGGYWNFTHIDARGQNINW